MAITRTDDDHNLMDRFIDTVLTRVLDDSDTTVAHDDLAKVIFLMGKGDADFRHHMSAAIARAKDA